MAFEHYVTAGGRRLREGYTTGTCAALAARAAAARALTGAWPRTVTVVTPKGLPVEAAPEERSADPDGLGASCCVRKDAGDDADVTAGALVGAHVRLRDEPGVSVDGGAGVGRVTKPGLDQPVGAAAINRVPRRMVEEAVAEELERAGRPGGASVTLFVPGGEALAARTFNPALGVEGGISILGTSGVVEPMSLQALADTVAVQVRQAAALAREGAGGGGPAGGVPAPLRLVLVPGNYGEAYAAEAGLAPEGVPQVKCSNFVGDALDEAAASGFGEILLVGHFGKLVKLAGGIMNTHSRVADCRMELVCAHAALAGAGAAACRRLMGCATTDACVAVLDEEGLRAPVMASLMDAAQRHLDRRVAQAAAALPGGPQGAPAPQAGAVVFSNAYGELGRTPAAAAMLARWGRKDVL